MAGIQEIDAAQLAELVAARVEDYLLVDVRTPGETAQGVEQATNLSGEIVGWHRQGYPVEKPDAAAMGN